MKVKLSNAQALNVIQIIGSLADQKLDGLTRIKLSNCKRKLAEPVEDYQEARKALVDEYYEGEAPNLELRDGKEEKEVEEKHREILQAETEINFDKPLSEADFKQMKLDEVETEFLLLISNIN